MRRVAETLLLPLALCLLTSSLQAEQRVPEPRTDKPDLKDVTYGPHPRNLLDLWKAPSERPTPLLIYIHGGGFQAGDKSRLNIGLLRACVPAGISFASIGYRLAQDAPFPAPMLDGARAVQFLRLHAAEYNLDPKRFAAAAGSSAGGGMELWIGFHDDLGDPKSADPVARQSSRLACLAVIGAQTSYDPRWIKKVIGGRAHEHPALLPFYGITAEEIDSPKAHELYEDASPLSHVSADDPPVYLFYAGKDDPLPANAKPGQGVHHVRFGIALKKRLDELKVECVLRAQGEDQPGRKDFRAEIVDFLRQQFGLKAP